MLTHARFKTRFALGSYPDHRLRTATLGGTGWQADLAIGEGIARLGWWNTFLDPGGEIGEALLDTWHIVDQPGRRCTGRIGGQKQRCDVLRIFCPLQPEGRKSVVWGKSVSVRVVSGGCRILKKN